MFDHSIRVPRLYKVAAKILQQVNEGGGSIKQLVYEKNHPNIKALFALVVLSSQKYNDINNLFQKTQLLTKEPRFDPWLARILITELIWGKKRLASECKPVKTILAYEQSFKAHLSDMTNSNSSVATQEGCNYRKPRYVRINTIILSLPEAVEAFRDEGWILYKHFDKQDYQGFLEKISNLEADEFLIDIHIPDLLVFPPRTEFHKHPAYKSGSIILQDKASCLPVHILRPPPGSVVLDMCAAPGMKTTQVAALMKDQGTVYAVEKDERRFQILNKMVEASSATCIQAVNKDVIQCDSSTFPGVEYILVDPSCSGSGMTDRLDFEEKESQSRLEKLAGFQIKILRSALTKYPDAKRVVYSTCSVHPEENEDVVRQVLETNELFKLVPAASFVNDSWHNFGSPDFGSIGKYCLYAKPNEDFTNGFFVAVFERLDEGETNEFFNIKIYNYKKHEEAQKQKNIVRIEKRRLKQNKRIIRGEENRLLQNRWEHFEKSNEKFQNDGAQSIKNYTEGNDTKNTFKEEVETGGDTLPVEIQNKEPVDSTKKKKKQKNKSKDPEYLGNEVAETTGEVLDKLLSKNDEDISEVASSKKQKKNKKKVVGDSSNSEEVDNTEVGMLQTEEEIHLTKKNKKKKKKSKNDKEIIETTDEVMNIVLSNKKPATDCAEPARKKHKKHHQRNDQEK